MQIPFNLQHAFSPGSPPGLYSDAVGILLDCQTKLIQAYRRAHPDGTLTPSGVRADDFYIFDIPFAYELDSDLADNSVVLEILLQCQVDLNRSFLRHYPDMPFLKDLPIVYGATDIWETLPSMFRRGYGDCKSLAPARVAEYLEAGQDARCVHRWYKRDDGYPDFHILVMRGQDFEDPSKEKGMDMEQPPQYL